jgi:hypothetical protein
MQAFDAAGMASGDHAFGQLHMCALEAVRATGVEDADEIDHRVGVGEFLAQYVVAIDIGAADGDLRQDTERAVLFAVATEHHDVMAVGGQPRHEMTAYKSGAAKDDDFLCGHGNQSCFVQRLVSMALQGDEPGVDDDVAGVMAGIGVGMLSGLLTTALAGQSIVRFTVMAFGSS